MWYHKDVSTLLVEFVSHNTTGLTSTDAKERLLKYGPNTLPTDKTPSLLLQFISQFKSVLIIILLIATALSAFLGDIFDAVAIFSIVILNAAIGTIQEAKAQKTLSDLKKQDVIYALVIRDGKIEQIRDAHVVPGDILILEEGSKIPADGRVIESFSLTLDESILTGESESVKKSSQTLYAKTVPLAEQTNMVFKDTTIVSGRGKALVVATGSQTEIGKIAGILARQPDEKSPLTKELDRVGHTITVVITVIAGGIFIINSFHGVPLVERILVAISLAVAAIPEGLPAIATITLALGVERLAQKKTIVKKLPAVETLGAIRIIATDKTGTLTENKINLTDIVTTNGKTFTVEGDGYSTSGSFYNAKGKPINPLTDDTLVELFTSSILASNAVLKHNTAREEFDIIGDTTEGAILIAAQRSNLDVESVRAKYSKLFELPFSQDRKMMSVVAKNIKSGHIYLYAKGAPEEIIERTTLSPASKKKLLQTVEYMAQRGLRTLAVAKRDLKGEEITALIKSISPSEEKLEFLGITGSKDTLRKDIFLSLQKAAQAGIKTVMITGDHIRTAAAIALECGIIKHHSAAVTEVRLAQFSRKDIAHLIARDKYRVFARVSPLGKLNLIEAIKLIPQNRVGVTGDGVNDAPALKAAHVGIAMGSGSQIAKDVADIVITDDNYATILEAIEEGRIIYANLIKFIRYLISCNLAEVLVVTLAVITGTGLPLLPIQLLWINLITDGLPALALGMDPPEPDIMAKPPRISEHILHARRWKFMLIEGTIMGVAVFFLYLFAQQYFDTQIAQTLTFTSLAIAQLIHAFSNRSTRKSIFHLGIFSNMTLIWSVLLSILLQWAAVHTHLGHFIFKTTSLTSFQWLLVFFVAVIPFIFVELKKVGLRKFQI